MGNEATLVAGLGGQPQVVTFTLDLLLQRGISIDQVIVVTLYGDERYQRAFERLKKEFANRQYNGRPCTLQLVSVRLGQENLSKVVFPNEVEAVRKTFFSLFAELKKQDRSLHISLSEGRRIMSLTAISAAMRFLTHADRLWHIYTPDDVTARAKQDGSMHLPPDAGHHLIEVPFVPWPVYFPTLAPILEEASETQPRAWLSAENYQRCQSLFDELPRRQREVLALLAEGLQASEVADRLQIAESTVVTHRKKILSACQVHWPEENINLSFIHRVFPGYFAGKKPALPR